MFALRPPPSLLEPRIRALSDRRIFEIASDGYGLMPPLAAWIAADDRWDVVSYVRALQLSADVPASALDAHDRAQLAGVRP